MSVTGLYRCSGVLKVIGPLEGCDMPTTQLMIQTMFEYSIVGSVTTLPAFYLQVFMDLDQTKTTVVREIAAEDLGGVVGLKMRGAVNLALPAEYLPRWSLTRRIT